MKGLHLIAKLVVVTMTSVLWLSHSSADDTEIYQAVAAATSTGRPKVLIVFDDSGSMRTDVTVQPPAYDPLVKYEGDRDVDKLYFSLNDSSEWIPAEKNRCAESYTPLASVGFFGGRVQRASWADSNRWRDLTDGDATRNTEHLECEADVINTNPSNGPGQPDGYPCESGWDVNRWYCSGKDDINWGSGETLYTGNYVNWSRGVGDTTRTRMEIAQDTINAIIDANPAIDFGLLKFNFDSGGQIRNRIIENSEPSDRDVLQASVRGLVADGWTPLCESTYEAYRYLSGLTVDFGDNEGGRDRLAESPVGTYASPTTDCAYTYIIIMTDGEPSQDTNRNTAIEELTGKTCNNYRDWNGNMTKNCLPEIVEYMANTDLDGDATNGDQFAITYTIGFATDQQLLEDTAALGKGKYYTADTATGLAVAFQSALTEILGTNESFTSPAVAVDTFSRTESRNEVFFAMFEPSDRLNWKGNIKRLNLVIEDGIAVLKDKDNQLAFNNSTGRISENATTVWSEERDGDRVDKGGVGALLAKRNPATRKLYSNLGDNGALKEYTADNVAAAAVAAGFEEDQELLDLYGVNTAEQFKAVVAWSAGFDIMDEDGDDSRLDARPWILADMLHSRPVVINYGARGSNTKENPDQRLIVGTNGGFLHMFDVADGTESWAFTPKELSDIHVKRMNNAASTNRVYGLDAPPSVYTFDGGDGTISGSGDRAIAFFGMRRGGRNIYALDITNPDSPEFLWQINGGEGAFSELGQTWSVPVITSIPGYKYDHDSDGDTPMIPKPVLIFGAGYDVNKDGTGMATADSMGRGLYIVDAFTGGLIWSISPGGSSGTNLQVTDLQHSVPATITPLDSNGDEITDRLYFADTGGHVWRVDMPGDSLPDSENPWRIVKMADMNLGTTATDRRFFNSPDIVRTKQKVCTEFYPAPEDDVCKVLTTLSYDAIVIGTGDRTNPNAIDVSNQFYMIRDEAIGVYTTDPMSETACDAAANDDDVEMDFRCYLPFAPSDLYDATSNIMQTGTGTQRATAKTALENAHGWKLNLTNTGEKSLARSLTLFGSIFFTTFSPDQGLITTCTPQPGKGRLYQVDIQDATAKRDFNNDGSLDRDTDLGSLIPDTPSPHFGSDKKIRLLFPSGGGLLSGNPLDSGAVLPQPYGIYWYREEL